MLRQKSLGGDGHEAHLSGAIVAAAAVSAILTHQAFGQDQGPSTLNANPTPSRRRPPQRAAQQAALQKLQSHGSEIFDARCKGCHMPPVEHAPLAQRTRRPVPPT